MEEQAKPNPTDLYLHADKKIEETRKAVEQLMLSDMNLAHKMDNVMTQQTLLKERVEEGVSKTVFKTFEAVKDIQESMMKIHGDNATRDHRIAKAEGMVEWIFRGFIVAMVLGAMLAIYKFK